MADNFKQLGPALNIIIKMHVVSTGALNLESVINF